MWYDGMSSLNCWGLLVWTDVQQTASQICLACGRVFLLNEQTSSMPARSCQRIFYNKDESIAAMQINVCCFVWSLSVCLHADAKMCFFPGQEGGATSVDGLNHQVLLVECCGAIMGVKGLWFLLYSNLKSCQNLLVLLGLICFPITS